MTESKLSLLSNFFRLEGEYLDLVLGLTISQPSSSSFFSLTLELLSLGLLLKETFSTDFGALRPLTVSAQDRQDPEELIDEVEPNGGTDFSHLVVDTDVGLLKGLLIVCLDVVLAEFDRVMEDVVADLDIWFRACWPTRLCLATKDTRLTLEKREIIIIKRIRN